MSPHRRTIAPRVVETHSRRCALTTRTGRRCTCTPRYRAQAKRAGRLIARTFADRAQALAWADSAAESLRRGTAPPAAPGPAPPLRDLAVSFLHRAARGDALTRSGRRYAARTVAGYESDLRLHVLPHLDARCGLPLGQLPASALDGRTIQRMLDQLAARRGPARARASAAALAAVLAHGYDRALVETLPPRVRRPAPPPARSRVLTREESARLLAAANADDTTRRRSLLGPLLTLLDATGMRISEALGLTWGPHGLDLDTDPPAARIARSTTKTDAGARTIYLDHPTAATLRRHYLACGRPADGAPVFPDKDGRPARRHGHIRSGIARAATAAKVEGLTPHVLRHTHATRLAAAGIPPALAAQRLGHADGGGFFLARYSHPGESEARLLLDLLNEWSHRAARG